MKLKDKITISFKYLKRYRRRYAFLFSALAIGFCIISVISSQKDGIEENVYLQAQTHYAGDVIVSGKDRDSHTSDHIDIPAMEKVLNAIDSLPYEVERVVTRTTSVRDITLFYSGESVYMKYIVGLDYENEIQYFNSIDWIGNVHNSLTDDTIYISSPIADKLKASVGDSVTVQCATRYRRKNTLSFIVGGIIHDTSIFGFYKVYVSRESLNYLLEFEPGEGSVMGVFLKKRSHINAAQTALYTALKDEISTEAPETRAETNRGFNGDWSGIRLFVLTTDAYLSDVAQLIETLSVVAMLLYTLMLLIIFVSAAVTYRLILHERTRELGTMRALGFKNVDIRDVLMLESVYLVTLAIIAGFILAVAVNFVLGFLSFSWVPSAEMFMRHGRLFPLYLLPTIAKNAIAVYLILLIAVYFPALSVTKQSLPRMLSAGAKG
jgi:ABC-type lipoprotein release transport system permease subunit